MGKTKKVKVWKACAILGEELPDLMIVASEAVPEYNGLLVYDEAFAADAAAIEQALHSILPGGTYDRLLAAMLNRTASSLIVPRGARPSMTPDSTTDVE